VLLAVEKDGAYANLELRKLTRRSTLAPSDISLLTELVYGTLRRQGTLDYVIEQHSTVPLSQMNYIIRSMRGWEYINFYIWTGFLPGLSAANRWNWQRAAVFTGWPVL